MKKLTFDDIAADYMCVKDQPWPHKKWLQSLLSILLACVMGLYSIENARACYTPLQVLGQAGMVSLDVVGVAGSILGLGTGIGAVTGIAVASLVGSSISSYNDFQTYQNMLDNECCSTASAGSKPKS